MLGLSVVLTPAGVEGLGWVWASVAFPSQLHIALVVPLFNSCLIDSCLHI